MSTDPVLLPWLNSVECQGCGELTDARPPLLCENCEEWLQEKQRRDERESAEQYRAEDIADDRDYYRSD